MACLGVIVGYGGEPEPCCALLREYVDTTVLGNHDAAVAGRMNFDYYRPSAKHALETHRSLISEASLQWLNELPYVSHLGDICFSHGVPPDHKGFEYLFASEQVEPLIREYDKQSFVTFVGHSHLCKSFSYEPSGIQEILRTRFTLDTGRKHIVSAGSVGQPRDYDSRACYGIYDTDDRYFQYQRLVYNIEAAARNILAANISEAFGRRLFLGV